MEELNSKLDDVINYIKQSSDYKKCVDLKKKMDNNPELKNKINYIKTLQKKYVKSNYDDVIKKELDAAEEELLEIPIYVVYNQSLDKVNYMINYVRDSLNNYFEDLLNKERN